METENLIEEWRDVVGFEGLYQVSNLGRVKGLDRLVDTNINNVNRRINKGKLLKPQFNNKGYKRVNLCKNGNKNQAFVHRLVAEAFIPNPNNYPVVNHKDENPKNNCVENLEWCDVKYNSNFGTRNQKVAKHRCKPVLQFTKEGELVKEWDSAKEASLKAGFNKDCISQCCAGKIKSHRGYIFKFKEA